MTADGPDPRTRTLRRTMLIALIAALAFAAGLAGWRGASAEAIQYGTCHDPAVSQAVLEVTGNTAYGHVCDPVLYNGGQWSTTAQLKSAVQTVMDRCGASSQQRNLTQAVIETSGVAPGRKAGDATCNKATYQSVYNSSCQSGCGGINWDNYYGNPGYSRTSALDAVYMGLLTCADPRITQAIPQEKGTLPNTSQYAYWNTSSQFSGQCSHTLYNHGAWYDFNDLASLVKARIDATGANTCGNTAINNAFSAATGWAPLRSECDPVRYGAGQWTNQDQLVKRVVGSMRCLDPWIGQIYKVSYDRNARGGFLSGECNPNLYGNGHWSGATPAAQYHDLEQKMGVTQTSLAASNATFTGSSGNLRIQLPGGQQADFPAGNVGIVNNDGDLSTAAGNQINSGGSHVIASGGCNIASCSLQVGGGSVIAAGSANLISDNGLGVIAAGGGNVIAAGGGN